MPSHMTSMQRCIAACSRRSMARTVEVTRARLRTRSRSWTRVRSDSRGVSSLNLTQSDDGYVNGGPAGAFTNSSSFSGDKLNTLVGLLINAMQHGMIYVGTDNGLVRATEQGLR